MKILLTGISTRAMVESALESLPREEVLTVDYFGDYDQEGLCENYSLKRTFHKAFSAQGLLEVSQFLSFDAVIYTSNLENHPSIIRKFQDRCLLLGNSSLTLCRIRNPRIFFTFLQKAEIPHPKTYSCPSTQYSALSTQHSEPSFLQKPVLSGGGFKISKVTTPMSWPTSRKKGQVIIQEYIEGTPCSALFLANGQDSVLIGLTEQLIGHQEFGSSGFRYCGNILGKIWKTGTGFDLIDRLAEISRTLTREFHLKGANGIDFILKNETPYLLEVNPRYTAAMELVEKAYNLHVVEAHVKSFEGCLPAFNLSDHIERGYWGKAILFAERSLKIPSIQKDWFERGIRDIPFEGEPISPGEPICTLFAHGASRKACYQELVEKARALKASLS